MFLAEKRDNLLIIYAAILSGASIALEIIMTNLFGILLTYVTVPIVIAIAIFGIGAGAFLAYDRRHSSSLENQMRNLGYVSASNSIFIAFLTFFIATFPFLGVVPIYVLVAIIPFVLFGWCISVVFQIASQRSALVYASQLFGDAIGVLAAYMGMNHWGGLRTLMFGSVVVGLVSIAILLQIPGQQGQRQAMKSYLRRSFPIILVCISIVLTYVVDQNILGWNFNYSQMSEAAPVKTLFPYLKKTSGSKIAYSVWDGFAKTDVVEVPGAPVKYVFQDGGAGSPIYRFNGQPTSIQSMKQDFQYVPFDIGSAHSDLVIGAGGGRNVLYSLLAGAKHITAVELNPGIVKSVLHFSNYDGHLFNRPGIQVVVGDGRNVIERSSDKYSIISLDMVYSSVSDTRDLSLTENYIFTKQAFQEYLTHLTKDGEIAVVSHNEVEGLRVLFTGFQALQDYTGATPAAIGKHLVLVMEPKMGMTLTIVSKQPFSSTQLAKLEKVGQSMGLVPVFVPTVNEQLLKPLVDGKVTLNQLDHAAPGYAIYPVTDNKPFFYQETSGLPISLWEWLGAILVLTISSIWYVRMRNVKGNKKRETSITSKRRVVYFALLGIGYMSVQLPLIEKYLLVLWNPVLSMAVVITSMVLGGGVGSYIVHRFRPSNKVVLFAMPVVILLQVLGLPRLLAFLLTTNLNMTIIVVAMAVFIVGVVLGLPFPMGLTEAEDSHRGSSAVYYAINGIASVWGTWIATATSIMWGFNATLLVSAGLYLAVWLFRPRTVIRPFSHRPSWKSVEQ